jgi:hypothetical protein
MDDHCWLGARYQYVPNMTSRACNIPNSDDKERMTALVMPATNGNCLPLFLICKHSKSSIECPDQAKMRVVSMLHLKDGFHATEHWEERIWTKELSNPKVPTETIIRKVRYIIKYKDTGHVLTSQVNAWNDEIRFMMYTNLILEPYMMKNNLQSLFLCMDNFSLHVKQSVVDHLQVKGNLQDFTRQILLTIYQFVI